MSETREKGIEFVTQDLKNSSEMNAMKDEAVFPEHSMADVSPQGDASYEFLEFISMDPSRTDKSATSDEDTLPELEEVETKSNDREECTDAASTVSADKKSSLANVNLKSIETAQTSSSEMQSVSTETESVSVCAETQKQTPVTQTSAIPKRNLHDTGELQEDIVIAPNKDKITLDRCSVRSAILQRNINDHMTKAKELSDCFISTQSRYAEEQNIIGECASMINAVESIKLADDKSLAGNDLTEYEKSLTNYRKKLISVQIQVVEDRQKMISVEKHYQKILSDYRRLVLELESVQLENEKMTLIEKEKQKKYAAIEKNLDERNKRLSEEKASLIKQQQSLINEKALVYEAMMNSIRTLELEKEKLLVGRKCFEDLGGKLADRPEPISHELQKPIPKKTICIKEQQALQQQLNAAQQRASMGIQRPTTPTKTAPQIKLSGDNRVAAQTDTPANAPQPSAPVSKAQANPAARNKSATNFVTCEICDVHIEDPEQLRNHMQWVHKFKIHPKMIYSKPPLNCQKCNFRFYTDQGLERHLLRSHGLVTSTMQEAANSSKDGGRCPVCGNIYASKLLSHVARDHGMTLKPAHLTYRCTVCAATFSVYEQFENHVYSAHSSVAKHAMDKKGGGPCALTSRPNDLL
ncbi:hypothetical protein TSAR_002733 [Trichomalopsis sarcophagae]|uniref:MOG interacting and ectopic P-granules protein 1 n=1 Tax=Trichomalopsis sarcophagae TaxID=543379 RepID=A0A232EJB1_9HYME|nr:hypothetical protein TSAR_002733 [Trichomalopsis sarcophagae]